MTNQEYEQYKKDYPENVSYSATSTIKEDINILFTGKELDKILKYQENCGAKTVQEAIMIAVSAKQ